MYKIKKELSKIEGGRSALAKTLKVSPQAVDIVLKKQNARFTTMQKYTKAFNKVFKTNYDFRDLFEKIEEPGERNKK